jgi:hypothetical protein
MQNISLAYVYQLAMNLEPIAGLPQTETRFSDIFVVVYQADAALTALMQQSIFSPSLRTSWGHCDALLTELRRIAQSKPDDGGFERKVQPYELFMLKQAYSECRIALLAELGALQSYFVTQKGGFDTLSLLRSGESLFPVDMPRKVPDALFDAREAGKCLAYEVPTAAGFHIFRATEHVLRKYYAQVTGGQAPPKIRSIGVYLKAMKSHADPKVWTALDQLTKLHRNPVIHPEQVLTMEDAIAILGLARSAITVMLSVLPVPPPTTATVVATASAATGGATP